MNLSRPEVGPRGCVCAAPTFPLDDRVLSPRNPCRSRLTAAVEAALRVGYVRHAGR